VCIYISQEGNVSPTESDFIVETVVDPQLCTIRKPFKIDFDFLEIDFDSGSNSGTVLQILRIIGLLVFSLLLRLVLET
jgi:hypothetical protein